MVIFLLCKALVAHGSDIRLSWLCVNHAMVTVLDLNIRGTSQALSAHQNRVNPCGCGCDSFGAQKGGCFDQGWFSKMSSRGSVVFVGS